ncbi:AlpA family phage regulatory protein [Candidatus Uhrbacteria bacterium]|nr:AlpA family phage regulatory protein [Candidatus Uhrbacteria bacterium]
MFFLRYPDLKERKIIGNRVTLDRWIKKGKFPAPVHLGDNTVAWTVPEVEAWVREKIAERDSVTSPADQKGQPGDGAPQLPNGHNNVGSGAA